MSSDLYEPLYNRFFYLFALCFRNEIFIHQLVQKFAAQVKFVPDYCFFFHFYNPPFCERHQSGSEKGAFRYIDIDFSLCYNLNASKI